MCSTITVPCFDCQPVFDISPYLQVPRRLPHSSAPWEEPQDCPEEPQGCKKCCMYPLIEVSTDRVV